MAAAMLLRKTFQSLSQRQNAQWRNCPNRMPTMATCAATFAPRTEAPRHKARFNTKPATTYTPTRRSQTQTNIQKPPFNVFSSCKSHPARQSLPFSARNLLYRAAVCSCGLRSLCSALNLENPCIASNLAAHAARHPRHGAPAQRRRLGVLVGHPRHTGAARPGRTGAALGWGWFRRFSPA